MQKSKRVEGLDIFRGWAIFLMVLYHFTFDLNHFGFIHVNMNSSSLFLISRYTIMSMFLLSVGISLALVHKDKLNYKSIKKRLLLLGGASILVSIGTYIEFPYTWVYFGILHFILVASLLALPFLRYPKVALTLAIAILVGSALNLLNMHPLFHLLQPILHLPQYTEDLVPLVPWFSVVLLGSVMVHYNLHIKVFQHKIFSQDFFLNRIFKRMGKHSLLIYLIHQPILFLLFELYFMLINP